MTLAKSTLTVATISNNPWHWTDLQNPIEKGKLFGEELKVLTVGSDFKVGHNQLLALDGLLYKTKELRAHFSITADKLGEWTYFHLTLVGGGGESAYYRLTDNDGELGAETTIYTWVDGHIKDVSRSPHYWKAVPKDVTHDVALIIRALVNKDWKSSSS
ncbi:MAG: hypothetical protein JNL82_09365 [Myxococcales bacterium]|nr:hypothetical protein [Myxococcales bacterium]